MATDFKFWLYLTREAAGLRRTCVSRNQDDRREKELFEVALGDLSGSVDLFWLGKIYHSGVDGDESGEGYAFRQTPQHNHLGRGFNLSRKE